MPNVPQRWRTSAAPHLRWLDPGWRRERPAIRRAWAWASLGLSLPAYVAACLVLAPRAGAGITLLYAIPCALAGWAFGMGGGLLVALLATPLHVWLMQSASLVELDGSPLVALALAGAFVVGLGAGIAREAREASRAARAQALAA